MKRNQLVFILWLIFIANPSAHANSVYFDTDIFSGTGEATIAVLYDFTDFPMYGGGFDLHYDTEALTFVSYTQADFSGEAQPAASPIGALLEPGIYQGAGIGTFEFFNGLSGAGLIGTFTFLFTPSDPYHMPYLELRRNAINPFVSLAGEDVTNEILGIVPIPAAFWLFASGILGLGFKTRFRR